MSGYTRKGPSPRHGRMLQTEREVEWSVPLTAGGNALDLADHARRILAMASLPRNTHRTCPPWRGAVVLIPWAWDYKAVRVAFQMGRVMIHKEDAGLPWGAALYLAIEAMAPDQVGLWRGDES